MTQRERFNAVFTGKKVDRLPIYFFGTWQETKLRWKQEGLGGDFSLESRYGPQFPGMDGDWEDGMWECHDIINVFPIGDNNKEIIEETDDYIINKYPTGAIIKSGKKGSTVENTIEYALKPTRESWETFKTYLNASDVRRFALNWQKKASELANRENVSALLGGSLYGWLRDWMGVEELSCLMYDDIELLKEMVSYITDYCIELIGPVAKLAKFDFVYIFEDCCGVNGPLFSPDIYCEIFDKNYRKLLNFYKQECGIPLSLIDSDGVFDKLIPYWKESGFDIMFPLEVGKWGGSPEKVRAEFGRDIGLLGGVDKHVIAIGGKALRMHLESLKPSVLEGRFLPIPDHRIPPEVSLEHFEEYIRVFNEVFNDL